MRMSLGFFVLFCFVLGWWVWARRFHIEVPRGKGAKYPQIILKWFRKNVCVCVTENNIPNGAIVNFSHTHLIIFLKFGIMPKLKVIKNATMTTFSSCRV
jgi:hypothetical protein